MDKLITTYSILLLLQLVPWIGAKAKKQLSLTLGIKQDDSLLNPS
jgi:hypothetical protein